MIKDLQENWLQCSIPGQRFHLLGFCCDCEALDETFDSLISSESRSKSRLSEVLDVLEDRSRIPWPGGARKVDPELFLPPLMASFACQAQALISLLSLKDLLQVACVLVIECDFQVPLALYVSSHGLATLILSHLVLTSIIIAATLTVLRRRPQTKFFSLWSLTTAAFHVGIYQVDATDLHFFY